MSNNIGNLTVGLGYDLSALEKGGNDAFRTINRQTESMSAEMKRASREGAESFRLIDEALGIHISRPLTKLITQEFPGFAKALQSVLGVGAAGALAVAGVEFFDKISEKIEKAQKSLEALKAASENVDKVFAEEMAAYKDKDKAITAAAAAVDRLAEAEIKQAKAAQEASGWFTQTLAAIGEWTHVASSFQSTLDLEQITGELGKFKQEFDMAAITDQLKHTHTAAALLEEEIKKVTAASAALNKTAGDRAALELAAGSGLGRIGPLLLPGSGVPQTELDAMKALLEAVTKIRDVMNTTTAGVHNQEAQAAALERQKEAARSVAELYRSIGESLKKLEPQTDPLAKLGEEIRLMKVKAEQDFRDLGKSSDSALQMRAAMAALDHYESRLNGIMAKARADADVVKAQAALPTTIAPTGSAPNVGASSARPALGAGGTAAAQISVFSSDQSAQLKAAAAAYQDMLGPQDHFKIAQSELNILLEKGLIDQAAYTAAMQKAGEEAAKSTDKLEKLLEKTGDASAGMQAFFLKLETDADRNGAFVFEILNKGLQGFEDETVKALTGGKTSWGKYFEDLDQMALKFMLNKGISDLFKGISGTGIGKSLGLDKIGGGAGAAAQQLSAGTIMQEAAAQQLAAANIMATSFRSPSIPGFSTGGSDGGGGDYAGVGIGGDDGIVPFNATGTDFAPGGLSWVGENGPELMNVPSGASITPSSSARAGHEVHVHIDARGGEIGVEDKIARAISNSAPHIILRAVTEATEAQRRTPR